MAVTWPRDTLVADQRKLAISQDLRDVTGRELQGTDFWKQESTNNGCFVVWKSVKKKIIINDSDLSFHLAAPTSFYFHVAVFRASCAPIG